MARDSSWSRKLQGSRKSPCLKASSKLAAEGHIIVLIMLFLGQLISVINGALCKFAFGRSSLETDHSLRRNLSCMAYHLEDIQASITKNSQPQCKGMSCTSQSLPLVGLMNHMVAKDLGRAARIWQCDSAPSLQINKDGSNLSL